jgi:hypothetical protein
LSDRYGTSDSSKSLRGPLKLESFHHSNNVAREFSASEGKRCQVSHR